METCDKHTQRNWDRPKDSAEACFSVRAWMKAFGWLMNKGKMVGMLLTARMYQYAAGTTLDFQNMYSAAVKCLLACQGSGNAARACEISLNCGGEKDIYLRS